MRAISSTQRHQQVYSATGVIANIHLLHLHQGHRCELIGVCHGSLLPLASVRVCECVSVEPVG